MLFFHCVFVELKKYVRVYNGYLGISIIWTLLNDINWLGRDESFDPINNLIISDLHI